MTWQDDLEGCRRVGDEWRAIGVVGADMDREESRASVRSGGGGRSGARGVGTTWGESRAEAIELAAEDVDGEPASRAELDVSHAGTAEVGQDGRPVDLAM